MKIVGIDASLNSTGICYINTETNKTEFHIIKPKLTKREQCHPLISYHSYEATSDIDSKLQGYLEVLNQLLKKINPDQVILEEPVNARNSRATISLSLLNGAIRALLILKCLQYKTVNVTHWKKEMVGNGAADKDLIVYNFKKLKPEFEPYTTKAINDISDAYFIANYAKQYSTIAS